MGRLAPRPGRALSVGPAVWVLAAVLAGAAAPATTDDAVEAKLPRLDGGNVRLSELRGHPVLLKMWATWCLPCREQAAILHDLQDELARRGVEVLAVDVGEGKSLVEKFVAKEPSDFPVVLDRGQLLATKLEIAELPALVLLDPEGMVAGTLRGLSKREQVLGLLDAVGD